MSKAKLRKAKSKSVLIIVYNRWSRHSVREEYALL
jgi:hypothetical protein